MYNSVKDKNKILEKEISRNVMKAMIIDAGCGVTSPPEVTKCLLNGFHSQTTGQKLLCEILYIQNEKIG